MMIYFIKKFNIEKKKKKDILLKHHLLNIIIQRVLKN